MEDQLYRHCSLDSERTQRLLDWFDVVCASSDDDFEIAQRIVRRLGVHWRDSAAEVGFFVPQLDEADDWFLEILNPVDGINFDLQQQNVRFERQKLSLVRRGDYLWGVVVGMVAGSRETLGSFYWLRSSGNHVLHDHLAYSVPFGTRAPAEFYHMQRLQDRRLDGAHFANLDWDDTPAHQSGDDVSRIAAPTNILQIHVGTASSDGTLEGLREIYARIAEKRSNGQDLDSFEKNYVGYDAVQLMPLEPPIEHEKEPHFWHEIERTEHQVIVQIKKYDIFNWGYDVMVSASPAVNPALTRRGRPDELVDLIAELHNFPDGPIKVIFDIVYGHTDNQAVGLFHETYLAGANMYGQNLNYRHPVARATWLEMQRRKNDYGVDGVRVDGAQDFKGYDPKTGTLFHDDEFLRQMNDVVQEVAGQRYRPWMVFEDGRPWPRDDWELASTYREVNRFLPNVWQWGPLTFAHNTPFLFTFWVNKSWRVREIAQSGKYWITGCANHDTLRRGTQVDPKERINTRLGSSLPEVFQNAYDHVAARLLDYCMMPGVPMDFINALMRAPWSFIRNTDDRYAVKVVSEEGRFLHWVMWEERWQQERVFRRLKDFGFVDLDTTRHFFDVLDHVMQAAGYDVSMAARMLNAAGIVAFELDVDSLKEIAQAWMADVFDYCNVVQYVDEVSSQQVQFNLDVREFRRNRPWLMENLRSGEYFDRQQPSNGTSFYYGLRIAPDGSEDVLFCANMEGEPVTFTPIDLHIPDLPQDSWELALDIPGVFFESADRSITLQDSQGIVLLRQNR